MSTADFRIYGLNVVFHASLLSIMALAAVRCFKNPHARSRVALLGLVTVAFAPWLSAFQVSSARFTILIQPTEIPNFVSETDPVPERAAPISNQEFPPSTGAPAKWEFPDSWVILAGIWCLGFGFMIVRQTVIATRFARWTRSLREPDATERQVFGSHGSFPVRIAAAGTSPFVAGISRPLLVIPEDFLKAGRERELRWALHHEVGHLRGHDLQWLALFQVIRAVFWWNPLVHRLVRLWAEAREQICDNLGIIDRRDAREYSEFLVSLGARRTSGIVMPMAARDTLERLKRRIGFVMEGKTWRPCGRGFLVNGILIMVLAGKGIGQVGYRSASFSGEATGGGITGNPMGPLKIVTRGKFVITREPVATNGQIILSGDMEELLAKINNTRSFPIMAAGFTQRSDDPRPRSPGISFFTAPVISDKDVILDCHASFTYLPGITLGNIAPGLIERKMLERVETCNARAQAKLSVGQWMCMAFGEIESGLYGTLFVQAIPQDVNGIDTVDFSVQTPVQLRATAWLLDGDGFMKDKAPGCEYDFFTPSEIETIRKTTKGQITDLPPVSFTSDRPPAPIWEAAPHLYLAAATRDGGISSVGFTSKQITDEGNGLVFVTDGRGMGSRTVFVTDGSVPSRNRTTAFRLPAAAGITPQVIFFKVER